MTHTLAAGRSLCPGLGKIASWKVVGVHGASAAQQCLAAGVLDEIQLSLAPVLLGNAGCSSIWVADSSWNAPR
jgi:hypothetical protein